MNNRRLALCRGIAACGLFCAAFLASAQTPPQGIGGPKAAPPGSKWKPPVIEQVPDMPGFPGVPIRLRSLADTLLKDPDLSALQRTEIYLRWLVTERKHPSQTAVGFGGGPIDSSYIQSQLVHCLASMDMRALRWLLTKRIDDAYVADAISIALGIAGDLEQHKRVAAVARRQSDGFLRMECVRALFDMGAPEARQVTEAMAAHDPFLVVIAEKPEYVARSYAKTMLHSLDLQALGRTWPALNGRTELQFQRDLFQHWLGGYDPFLKKQTGSYDAFVKEHAADLERLLRIANGHLDPGK